MGKDISALVERLRQEQAQGHNLTQAARKTGYSRSYISVLCQREGIDLPKAGAGRPRGSTYGPKPQPYLDELLQNGVPHATIAALSTQEYRKITKQGVRDYCTRAGLREQWKQKNERVQRQAALRVSTYLDDSPSLDEPHMPSPREHTVRVLVAYYLAQELGRRELFKAAMSTAKIPLAKARGILREVGIQYTV